MRTALPLVPLTLSALLLSCQDGNGPSADPSPPSVGKPLAEVFRTRFFHDGVFIHTGPGFTFTIGLVTPIADLTECGGSEEFVSDVRATNQVVVTPAGPERLLDRVTGTFVLYDVSFDFEEDDLCDLADFVVGTGQGSFTRTDNSQTGVGPGMNAFGFMANALLELTDGSRATFHAVVRWLYDGEEITTLVEKVELKPTGH